MVSNNQNENILKLVNKLEDYYCLEESDYNFFLSNNENLQLIANNEIKFCQIYFLFNNEVKTVIMQIDKLIPKYFMIKILYKEKYLNILINRNEIWNNTDILNKVNRMKFLKSTIKFVFHINEFPLVNYYLNNTNKFDNNFDAVLELINKNVQINNNNFINNDYVFVNNNNNINNNLELNNLKKELIMTKKKVEEQKTIIKKLQTKIQKMDEINVNNLNVIQSLENEISQKKKELDDFKIKFDQINSQGNNNIQNIQLKAGGQLSCVNFTSVDNRIHFAIPCYDTDIFAFVEEKLYQEYPEYRETNNSFIFNGDEILRFKSISSNKIGNGKLVILVTPNQNWKNNN